MLLDESNSTILGTKVADSKSPVNFQGQRYYKILKISIVYIVIFLYLCIGLERTKAHVAQQTINLIIHLNF